MQHLHLVQQSSFPSHAGFCTPGSKQNFRILESELGVYNGL